MNNISMPLAMSGSATGSTRFGVWTPIIVICVLFSLVPLMALIADQPFLTRVSTRIVVFSIAAVSLNILISYAGLVSVMHAGVLGLGGYIVAILAKHGSVDLALSVPLAIAGAAAASALFGLIALRTSGAYFIMITLAFNQMLYYLFVSADTYGGDEGLQIMVPLTVAGYPIGDRTTVYYACLATLVLVLVGGVRLVSSRFGMVIRAASGNERRVAAVGIAPLPYRLVALVLTGAVAGLAGALLATSQQFISPADMAWSRSGELIIMVVLGGMARVWGPVLGAVTYLLFELLLSALTIHWQLPFGILIIVMITFLGGGLTDLVPRVTRLWKGGRHD